MRASARRICTGDEWGHDPTIMSIAVAYELLRCPICGAEHTIRGVPA